MQNVHARFMHRRREWLVAAALLVFSGPGVADGTNLVTSFSAMRAGGDVAEPWQHQALPKVERDVAADFERLFGEPAPRIAGIVLGADTDNTGGRVTAWFGDLSFVP